MLKSYKYNYLLKYFLFVCTFFLVKFNFFRANIARTIQASNNNIHKLRKERSVLNYLRKSFVNKFCIGNKVTYLTSQ